MYTRMMTVVEFNHGSDESQYTANIFTAKTTGFHCVTNPTAVSLHFLQINNANIECKKLFTVGCL